MSTRKNKRDDLIPVAFAIPDDYDTPSDSDEPPIDGMDYLRRVRREARSCAPVKISKINPRSFDSAQNRFFPELPKIESAPPGLSPSLEWQTIFLQTFEGLRINLSQCKNSQSTKSLPMRKDASKWHEFCFGVQGTENIGNLPTLSTMVQIDQVTCNTLLEYHTTWLKKSKEKITPNRCTWLFSIFAKLDTPLNPDTAWNLRKLLRLFAAERAKITDPNSPILPHLNIIITIISKYFKQEAPEDT